MAKPITLTSEGMLLNWLKDVGDTVSQGDVIAELEADKATMEIEAPSDGVLLEKSAEVGQELSEGAVLGLIGEAGEAPAEASAAPAKAEQAAPAASAAPAAAPAPASNGASGPATTEDGRIKASPVARNIADERGIDLHQVTGTGPGGRITKKDVMNFDPAKAPAAPAASSAAPAAVPSAPAAPVAGQTYGALPQGDDVEIVEISRMRKTIANSTVTSMMLTPHFYLTVSIDVDPMLALRKQLNASLESEGIKISVNDMVVKATALTLKKFPNLNTHYYGDKLVKHKRINVGIAVSLPNNGLINVVAQDADKKALSVMASENKAMFERAREGKIKTEDIQGATFTTSNLGPYGIEHFQAIISPPEAGILAVGSAKKTPIVKEDGTLGIGNMMNVTLSVDHRVSDGAEGAEFLKEFKALLENPMRLLV